MKKQSARARAQSALPVRHQLDHAVPTVIHKPEEKMTALGRWAHHAVREPRRYLGWPAAVIAGAILATFIMRATSGGSSGEAETWSKLEAAGTPSDRVELAKANPKSVASTWALLQAASEYFSQALTDMPNNRDVALPTSKKALDLFDQVCREAPHNSPQARAAALGKARVLEMRNELPEAIKQYELVAQDKDWKDSAEAAEAKRFAEALKDPQAAAFYKELYAYSPTKVTLAPFGTETLQPPLLAPPTAPGSSTGAASRTPSDLPPPLAPGLSIPGIREVIEPKAGGPTPPAQPTPGAPAAKPGTQKAAGTQKDLPADVFAPASKKFK